jgi:hypothetical protein
MNKIDATGTEICKVTLETANVSESKLNDVLSRKAMWACDKCNGKGRLENIGTKQRKCISCNGIGLVLVDRDLKYYETYLGSLRLDLKKAERRANGIREIIKKIELEINGLS